MSIPLNPPVKRSITIAGHRTSITLELVFWELMDTYARRADQSLNEFVSAIDARRDPGVNLSSAIRQTLVGLVILERDKALDA